MTLSEIDTLLARELGLDACGLADTGEQVLTIDDVRLRLQAQGQRLLLLAELEPLAATTRDQAPQLRAMLQQSLGHFAQAPALCLDAATDTLQLYSAIDMPGLEPSALIASLETLIATTERWQSGTEASSPADLLAWSAGFLRP
ncbi:CesT family type III secretion system chaperone [uncultured Thiohalocapsa sp.]|uniref:CesT family type III secretion system chaperone n=1 Tax=uncultured Thiohalocapsa sp. TaxID=768990 RepID=UPI0025DAE5FF|nr:CesT family type III secretion system chaperone [uncultured Thiohalocapsa sp.]